MAKTKHTRQTIKYFSSHIRNYKWSLVAILIGITIGVIFGSILNPLLYREIIDLITEFDGSDRSEVLKPALAILLIIFIVDLIQDVGWRMAQFFNSHFQTSIMRDIANDCFRRLHNHSLSFFSNNFIGSLVTKTKRLIGGFERIMDLMYWEFLTTILEFVFTTIILFTAAPVFGWIMIAWSAVYVLVTGRYYLWKMKYDLQAANTDSEVTGAYADSLTNFFNVKIFARSRHEHKLFGDTAEKQKRIRKFTWDLSTYMDIFQGVFMTVLYIAVVYYSIVYWVEGTITIGTVVLVQAMTLQLLRKLWNVGHQIKDTVTAFADCEEMVEMLYETPEIRDPADPEPSRISRGHIQITDLLFRYEDNAPVFQDFNLDISPGEKVGLVGESGSGKSTLTKVLFRFNDINEGLVTIDGQDITQITQEDLRQNISFVPQEPILFHRSLEENIRYGNLDATKEEVIEAAKKAHAHEFITKTKEGYDTLVGERGIKLSGGEKQRIAIARAMLKRAPILILDEATSALDSVAETHIQEALEELMKDCTTIVIAHRLSTLRKMDRIIVLDHGKIVEQGSHTELVELDGKYNELWSHQVGGFIQE